MKIFKIFSRGYDGAESNRMRSDLGWGRRAPSDEDSLISDNTLEKLRQRTSDFRRNHPIVSGACERFGNFVVGGGIIPQARTSSADWNKVAENFFMRWFKICDYRQRLSGWNIQHMATSLRPTHGGMYIQLLDNGQILPIETERIRQPTKKENQTGFVEGVRVDKSGIILGYQIHSRDKNGGFGAEHAERFERAENIIPVIKPPWRPDQIREIPDLAPVMTLLQDIKEMNEYLLNTTKAQSGFIGFLKKQFGGGGIAGGPRGAQRQVGSRQVFNFDWGKILEGFPGDDLEMKGSPNPNSQYVPYLKTQLMMAAASMDVPYEFFTLDFSSADFSRQKAILLLVNKSIRIWRKWLNETLNQRLWNWRIAKAMKNGEIPLAPIVDGISEWWKVDWHGPEEPWSDRQEAQQADVLEIQSGLGTHSAAAKRRGYDFEQLLIQKAEDELLIDSVAGRYGIDASRLVKMEIPGQSVTDRAEKEKDVSNTDGATGGGLKNG